MLDRARLRTLEPPAWALWGVLMIGLLTKWTRSPLAWVVVLVALATLADLWVLSGRWMYVRGYEVEWIARGLAGGHGFSFPGNHQWLFAHETGDPEQYFATAWQAPLYPAWVALWLRLLGEGGLLVVMVGQVLAVRATCVLVYVLGRRLFTPTVGLAGAAVLTLLPHSHVMGTGQVGSAAAAGLLVTLSALMGLWCMDRPSVRRAAVWGALLGVTALVYAGTQLLAPAAAVVLLWRGWGGGRAGERGDGDRSRWAWRPAFALAAATVLVVSPWTLRNYATFGELVPVRNGLGQIVHMGNPMVVQTYRPGVRFTDAPTAAPPWRAASLAEALDRVRRDEQARAELTAHARAVVEQEAPPEYATMNEAQRDALYTAQSKRFMLSYPLLTAELSVRKLTGFFWSNWRLPGAVMVLALAGLLLVRWDARVWLMVAWVAVFALPYAVTFPWFYRYRYPVEPLVAVFAGVAVVAAVWGVAAWTAAALDRLEGERAARPTTAVPGRLSASSRRA
ncbi:glycosyltransferase family 39 protein [Phycisphaerales bacterium AB-hyl4]|uniref:Glycosyltransferase family 39 protein n=1 Tax=Natronomicrosphaera hydrolytica TaxID=3242702 RepID=A0ABV4UAR9_9BACT